MFCTRLVTIEAVIIRPVHARLLSSCVSHKQEQDTTGVWMKFDHNAINDEDEACSVASAVAVMGKNLKWQIGVNETGRSFQSQALPAGFIKVCSLEEAAQKIKSGICDDDDVFEINLNEAILGLDESLLPESFVGGICQSDDMLPMLHKIGVYENSKEETLGKAGRLLLLHLENYDFDDERFEYIATPDWINLPEEKLLKLPDLSTIVDHLVDELVLKNNDERKALEEAVSHLNAEGWELRWNTVDAEWGDVCGGLPDMSGDIYLGDGVYVNESSVHSTSCTPYLHMPFYDEKYTINSFVRRAKYLEGFFIEREEFS